MSISRMVRWCLNWTFHHLRYYVGKQTSIRLRPHNPIIGEVPCEDGDNWWQLVTTGDNWWQLVHLELKSPSAISLPCVEHMVCWDFWDFRQETEHRNAKPSSIPCSSHMLQAPAHHLLQVGPSQTLKCRSFGIFHPLTRDDFVTSWSS